jgi:tetratricopeptide (TPR) repeat protein
MCLRRFLAVALVGLLAFRPSSLKAEDQTLQYQYLKIYLAINTADQLERQGDFQGALAQFKDCYTRLQRIHNSDPSWESALVIQRMNDCRSKIVDLSNRPLQQMSPASPGPDQTSGASFAAGGSAEVTELKQKLMTVEQELQEVKAKYQNSQLEVTSLRAQLSSVNQQLTALKSAESEDHQVGKLLTENQELTEKLDAAQKEIDSIKSNPRSALALVRTQLKNTQDKLDASEAANTALQATTQTLRQQLDDAQSDLRVDEQRLAAAPSNAPEYQTLKRENEVMRDILTRELQEQAHRDMAKRLAQEEFDRLRLTSKVLQEQLDILGSPMTPPSTEQERALLDNLKVASVQVAPVPSENGNSFSVTRPSNAAADSGTAPGADTNAAPAVASDTNAPSATETNAAPDLASSTHSPAATPGSDTNAPSPGNSVATDTNAAPEVAASTNAPATTPPLTNEALTQANESVPAVTPTPENNVTPAGSPPATNTSDTTPSTNSVATAPETNAAPAATTNEVATTNPSETTPAAPDNVAATPTPSSTNTPDANPANPGTTNNSPPAGTPNEYASKPRLPDDMRDTAQQAADLFKMQRYDDAAAKYQDIIEKYPDSLYAWSNLGVVRFQEGKLPEALKALQQAVKLSPTDAFSYSNLGIVYYQMNQYENAISALERALALDPTNAKSHNYLGCACSQKGWTEVAEKEFLKAIEIDDTFGDAHFNLALVYATEKPPSMEMARRHYKRALELGISPDPRLEKLLQMDGVAQNPPATEER